MATKAKRPCYNKEGIGDAHLCLLELCVTFGNGKDWNNLFNATKLITSKPAFPSSSWQYIADKKYKLLKKKIEDRFSTPEFSKTLICGTFEENQHISKLFKASRSPAKVH